MLAQHALAEGVDGEDADAIEGETGVTEELARALVDDPGRAGGGVRRRDRLGVVRPQLGQLADQPAQAQHQLGRGLFREGDDQNLVGRDGVGQDEIDEEVLE